MNKKLKDFRNHFISARRADGQHCWDRSQPHRRPDVWQRRPRAHEEVRNDHRTLCKGEHDQEPGGRVRVSKQISVEPETIC